MKKLHFRIILFAAITLPSLVMFAVYRPAVVWVLSFVNSAIFLTVVSTFAAAYAGTWGAQWLAEHSARRREFLTEIRNTNAAIGLACNIANTYISINREYIQGTIAQYWQQRHSYQKAPTPEVGFHFIRFFLTGHQPTNCRLFSQTAFPVTTKPCHF